MSDWEVAMLTISPNTDLTPLAGVTARVTLLQPSPARRTGGMPCQFDFTIEQAWHSPTGKQFSAMCYDLRAQSQTAFGAGYDEDIRIEVVG